MPSRLRVAVIGGGISGVAAAHFLSRADEATRPEVHLIEAGNRLGGKVLTRELAGYPVEAGPDTLVLRTPEHRALMDELGLTGDVVTPAAQGSYVWSRGRLRNLPVGAVSGLPSRLWPLIRSGLISPVGLARAGLGFVVPRRTSHSSDPSIGELVRPPFGDEVFERIVAPLLGGVFSGPADLISARSTVPHIMALTGSGPALYFSLRRLRRSTAAGAGSKMCTLQTGLSALVEALSSASTGCTVRTSVRAESLERADDGYRLALSDGTTLRADAVVLATPAYATAGLLEPLAPQASAALREVAYNALATVLLAYPEPAVSRPLDATGFLVPPCDGRLIVGCSWLSAKWPHLVGGGMTLIRCVVGRYGDQEWPQLDDDTLAGRVHDELVQAMGMTAPPAQVHIERWPQATPIYTVGHGDRVGRVEAALADLPGLHVTGAAYHGAGVASCLTHAQNTAVKLSAELA